MNLTCGEKLGVRNPCAPNTQWRNRAPMFYTAARPIFGRFPTPEETALKNAAMAERFKIRSWYVSGQPPPRFPALRAVLCRVHPRQLLVLRRRHKISLTRLHMDMRRCHVVLLQNYMKHAIMFHCVVFGVLCVRAYFCYPNILSRNASHVMWFCLSLT